MSEIWHDFLYRDGRTIYTTVDYRAEHLDPIAVMFLVCLGIVALWGIVNVVLWVKSKCE